MARRNEFTKKEHCHAIYQSNNERCPARSKRWAHYADDLRVCVRQVEITGGFARANWSPTTDSQSCAARIASQRNRSEPPYLESK